MLKKLLFSLALISCLNSYSSAEVVTNNKPFDDSVLRLGYLGISVATISEIRFEKQSDTLPPLPVAKLNIEESIRGVVSKNPRFSSLFYRTERSKYKPSDQILEWGDWTLADLIGKKFIVVTNGLDIIQLYPYSASLREHIVTHKSGEGLDDNILMFLFVLLIGLSLIPRKYSARISTKAPVLLLVAQIVIYGLYEWGTPSYYNIRVDLLFIIPAIILNWVLTVRYVRGRTKPSV